MGALTQMIHDWITDTPLNFDLGIFGSRGHGKSYCAITLAVILSAMFKHKFGIEYIHFKAKELLKQIHQMEAENLLKPGMVFMLDEAGIGMDAQEWWDTEIKALANEMETYRTYKLIIIFTSPMMANITKRAREMFTGYMIPDMPRVIQRRELTKVATNILKEQQMSKWKIYLTETEAVPRKGKLTVVWKWHPRNKTGFLKIVKVQIPPVKLRNEYEKKKLTYLRQNREERIRRMEMMEGEQEGFTDLAIVNEIKRNIKRYTKAYHGRKLIRGGLVKSDFDIGEKRLKNIKDLVEYDLNEAKEKVM